MSIGGPHEVLPSHDFEGLDPIEPKQLPRDVLAGCRPAFDLVASKNFVSGSADANGVRFHESRGTVIHDAKTILMLDGVDDRVSHTADRFSFANSMTRVAKFLKVV